jgi:hypothetical protein
VLGIIMLDARFPRIPGDVGNANTWPFPVKYHVVSGAEPWRIMGSSPDPALLEPFVQAARELEAFGVGAITTSCGFLAPFQDQIAGAVSIPVVTSALMMVPVAYRMTGSVKPVGILTERASYMTEAHFRGAGWSSKDTEVRVHGMPDGAYFPDVFIGNAPRADLALLERDMRQLAECAVKKTPEIGALVFECVNFVPWSHMVHEITGLPIFHIVNAAEMAAAASFRRSYDGIRWRSSQP